MEFCFKSQDQGRPLPKFGEWDVNDPASAEGFTVIFNKARDEKKTGGKTDSPRKLEPHQVRQGAIPGKQPVSSSSAGRILKGYSSRKSSNQKLIFGPPPYIFKELFCCDESCNVFSCCKIRVKVVGKDQKKTYLYCIYVEWFYGFIVKSSFNYPSLHSLYYRAV
ncbi:hypothetical protein ACFE04_023033 [Oxalis oulophora]